jgi:hypothetical protein
VTLAILLIVEVVPYSRAGVPFPPAAHPAFEWLRQQPSAPQEGIVDLYPVTRYTLALPIRGETIFATLYHGKPTVSGASSVWPSHTIFLNNWLLGHPHPFQNVDFVPLLRYYRTRFIVLHMQGAFAEDVLEEARHNNEIGMAQCFSPPQAPSPWPYPICVLEVLPRPMGLNVLFRKGWSGKEEWGIWAEGMESRAQWVATSRTDQRLSVEVFPLCVAKQAQHITFETNGALLTTHAWRSCEPWSGEVTIPASLIQVGWNELVVTSAYAARPVDVTGGENPDARALSVGFTRLEIGPIGMEIDAAISPSPMWLERNVPPVRDAVAP